MLNTLKIIAYPLFFKSPSGTSRGILKQKMSYILVYTNQNETRYGEVSYIPGLNHRTEQETLGQMKAIQADIQEKGVDIIDIKTPQYPALQFGVDMLQQQKDTTPFSRGLEGIKINGLIWMGTVEFMKQQIRTKLDQGFSVIKMKIGAIQWKEELEILQSIRKEFSASDIELRVDANGGFQTKEIRTVLNQLAELKIHSIEQPIKQGNWEEMAKLCLNTPVPIALDEELIGVIDKKDKAKLLQEIKPQYLILKPGLMGGISSCNEWIELTQTCSTNYWITSALESNLGLNAIAQWTYSLKNQMPQGLGTGGLFTNNFPSPLEIKGEQLYYNPAQPWDYANLMSATVL